MNQYFGKSDPRGKAHFKHETPKRSSSPNVALPIRILQTLANDFHHF